MDICFGAVQDPPYIRKSHRHENVNNPQLSYTPQTQNSTHCSFATSRCFQSPGGRNIGGRLSKAASNGKSAARMVRSGSDISAVSLQPCHHGPPPTSSAAVQLFAASTNVPVYSSEDKHLSSLHNKSGEDLLLLHNWANRQQSIPQGKHDDGHAFITKQMIRTRTFTVSQIVCIMMFSMHGIAFSSYGQQRISSQKFGIKG